MKFKRMSGERGIRREQVRELLLDLSCDMLDPAAAVLYGGISIDSSGDDWVPDAMFYSQPTPHTLQFSGF